MGGFVSSTYVYTVVLNNFGIWNGTNWYGIDNGTNNTVTTVSGDTNGKIYIGGLFTTAGTNPVDYVASLGNNYANIIYNNKLLTTLYNTNDQALIYTINDNGNKRGFNISFISSV